MTTIFLTNLLYLSGLVCFVLGLRLMSNPGSVRKGNFLAGAGMCLAILAAVMEPFRGAFNNYALIVGGLLVGAVAGYFLVMKRASTLTTPVVAIFNGLGGACAAVLGLAKILLVYNGESAASSSMLIVILFTLVIGGVVFTGSLLAYAKMEGLIKDSSLALRRHGLVNVLLLTITVFCGIFVYLQGGQGSSLWAIVFMLIAMVYGVYLVAPIAAADMLLVIALLHAFSGLSAAATGLIYGSQFMLVGGVLVAAAGVTLTFAMCRTMNRSLIQVLTEGIGSPQKADFPNAVSDIGEAKEIDQSDNA
ncbi:MAG: NAD(P)(+) transhydrogenase (Re/Si-specific) subunit beta [Saprospiraceae bacterium]